MWSEVYSKWITPRDVSQKTLEYGSAISSRLKHTTLNHSQLLSLFTYNTNLKYSDWYLEIEITMIKLDRYLLS